MIDGATLEIGPTVISPETPPTNIYRRLVEDATTPIRFGRVYEARRTGGI